MGTIDPSILKPIVDKAVDDALDGYTPPGIDPIIERIEQAEQDAEQAKQDALNALAQADAANAYTDEQLALVNQDILALEQATGQIADDLQDGLNAANAYTDTGFASYNETIQGQFASFAGQIEQLTAALTSANLVQNGLFALGDATWTLTAATVLARADLTGLGAAAPQPNLVELDAATAASISTELNTFAVTANDRVQVRFFAAATATRTVTVTLAWEDAAGNPVGTPSTETLTITPANTWKAYGKQVDPPDTAVGATLTISKASGGAAALITAVEVSTVNVALEARVTQIEATQITETDVIAIIGAQVNSRFDDAFAAIEDEATTRASEDSALTTRQTRLSATIDREAGGVLSDPYLASSGWIRYIGQGTLVLRDNEKFDTGRTWDFTTTAAQQEGVYFTDSPDTIWPGAKNADAYVIEVDYTLMSGTLGGAHVLLDWNGSTGNNNRAQKTLADMTSGPVEIGRFSTARGVFKRPSPFVGTFTTHDLFVMANYGTGMAAKRIKFHRVKVRVATDEEVGSGEVMNAVKAELSANHYTKAQTNQAIAGFDLTGTAQLGTAWAQVKQSATALAGLDGSVARFRNIVTVDGELVAAGIEAVAFNNVGGATGSLLKLIGDNVIAEGTLSTNALVVGLGGNLVVDPSFDDGFEANWIATGNLPAAQRVITLRLPGQTYAHPGWPTLMIFQNTGYADGARYGQILQRPSANGAGARHPGVPVTPGKRYMASAYFRTINAEAQLYLYWYDASGTQLGSPSTARKQFTQGASASPDAWERASLAAVAPTGAAFASISFIKRDTLSGFASSYLFIWKPQLEEIHAKATEPKAWSPGGTTYINGGRLFAKSILTRHLDTDDLEVSGLAIFNGRLQSDNFDAASFTGWRITKAGVMNMPRAIIKSAHIDNAQILFAHIKDLEVDTIKIRGNAISTYEASFTASMLQYIGGNGGVVQSLTYMIGRPGPQLIDIYFGLEQGGGNDLQISVQRVSGGVATTIWAARGVGIASGGSYSQRVVDPGTLSGSVSYRMVVTNIANGAGPVRIVNRFMGVLNVLK
ncbi:hypothetical protein [Paracoccus sp. 22332]|uniref:hypothetical protein n=1 Tax=Paracoccus sp. 22332 TaxID=3453913 RepID=UPI003F86E421